MLKFKLGCYNYSSPWLKGHLTHLARVSFGYPFDIYVLGNPTGFVPNSSVLRITPVLG